MPESFDDAERGGGSVGAPCLVTPDLLAPGSLLVPYGTVSALAPDLLDAVDKVVVDDWREARSGRPAGWCSRWSRSSSRPSSGSTPRST